MWRVDHGLRVRLHLSFAPDMMTYDDLPAVVKWLRLEND